LPIGRQGPPDLRGAGVELGRHLDLHPPPVLRVVDAAGEAGAFEAVDGTGDGPGRDPDLAAELPRGQAAGVLDRVQAIEIGPVDAESLGGEVFEGAVLAGKDSQMASDWLLELVQVVSDLDRAKAFYEQVGFIAEHDHQVSEELRFVQLTPPGSACSIALTSGAHQMAPGSIEGLQLVVPDADLARAELLERGVEVGEVQEFPLGPLRLLRGPRWQRLGGPAGQPGEQRLKRRDRSRYRASDAAFRCSASSRRSWLVARSASAPSSKRSSSSA
jgi:catechol 2,3-dioxygenase-like lactoylglutathione lyase family enzyme